MRSPLRILVILAAMVLFIVGCSSTVTTSESRTTDQTADDSATGSVDEAGTSAASGDADASTGNGDGAGEGASEDEAGDTSSVDDAGADGEADTTVEEPASARDLQSAPGFRLGGAEQLGALSNDCTAGNDMACDILFQISGFDSDEEATAVTCGGRSEVEVTFCTEGIDAAPTDLVFDPNSEGLPAIIDACRQDGDMTACDFLFFRSPLESDIEMIGATCGERVEIAVPDCRTFLTEAE